MFAGMMVSGCVLWVVVPPPRELRAVLADSSHVGMLGCAVRICQLRGGSHNQVGAVLMLLGPIAFVVFCAYRYHTPPLFFFITLKPRVE